MSMNDANDFLMGGGGAPALFKKGTPIGTVHKGAIVKAEVVQQIDFDTDKPKFWDDGKPMMQAVITLATDERDPANADDDGQRRLFAKGAMQKAVREAVIAAGAKSLEVGGQLAVKYTGDDAPKKAGMNGAKLYQAEYRPPAISADSMIDEAPAAAPPAAPAPQPAPAAAPATSLL